MEPPTHNKRRTATEKPPIVSRKTTAGRGGRQGESRLSKQ